MKTIDFSITIPDEADFATTKFSEDRWYVVLRQKVPGGMPVYGTGEAPNMQVAADFAARLLARAADDEALRVQKVALRAPEPTRLRPGKASADDLADILDLL